MMNDRQRQLMRELNSTTEGATRFMKGMNSLDGRGKFGDAGVSMKVITPYISSIATSLDTFMQDNSNKRRKPVAVTCLMGSNTTSIATLTCSSIMSFTGVPSRKSRRYMNFGNALAIWIGQRIDQERMQEALYNDNKELFTRLTKRNLSDKEWTKFLSDLPTMEPWDDKQRYQVGATLLEFSKDAGIVTMTMEWDDSGKQAQSYELSEQVRSNLSEALDEAAQARPVRKPMICKPKPWTLDDDGNATGGGYLTIRSNLIKRQQR